MEELIGKGIFGINGGSQYFIIEVLEVKPTFEKPALVGHGIIYNIEDDFMLFGPVMFNTSGKILEIKEPKEMMEKIKSFMDSKYDKLIEEYKEEDTEETEDSPEET